MNKHILAGALLSAGLMLSNAAQAQVQDLTTWTATGGVSASGSSATMISYGTSTSSFGGTNGSLLSKTFNLVAGDKISFDWLFKAGDYLPYNDFALFSLNDTKFKLSDVATVGNYGSSGLQSFSYTATNTGAATLSFLVSNYSDTNQNSTLQVSNVNIAAVPEPETYALMATGLLGLLFSRKKKVAVQAAA